MLKKTLATSVLASSIALALSAPTMAYEAGDILLRVGTATVAPEKTSDGLSTAPTVKAEANDNTQLGISGTYMITDQLGVEVLGATPFTHEIELKDGTPVGEIKHLPPTVSAQYFPMDKNSKLQPYVGAGLNVTVFFDEDSKLDGYDLSLDNSVGLAVQAGVDYTINDKMFVNASAMYAKIGTTATFSDDDPSTGDITVDYDLDPMVYRLNFGYKF
ncbi:OmpW family protein [Bermanella sp. R86510]|uniref:OmpW/AlkL family protein n=1 Tax=unclassified Bermanella TaxID=2627862 RepID=UPI0037C5A97D